MHSHAGMWFTQGGLVEDGLAHARRAAEYARATGCPTLLANTLYSLGAALAPVDSDAALAAFNESISVGTTDSSAHWVASLYTSALLLARRGEAAEALSRLRLALQRRIERGELPQLDGGLGYSIEILTELGQLEAVCVLIGAIRSGALGHFRSMSVPPERRPDKVVKRLRDELTEGVRSAATASVPDACGPGRPSLSAGGCPPAPAAYPGVSAGGPPSPCLALLRVGFAEPPGSPRALVRSYRTVSPLPVRPAEPSAIGGLFSVALSCGSPRLGVTQHRALWSPDVPRTGHLAGPDAAARPTRHRLHCYLRRRTRSL